MKKIIIALAALLTVATTANAQQMYQRGWSSLDSPNSISVGYGLSAIGIALNTVSNYFSFVDDIAQEDITISNGGSSGFINLSYGYQLNRTFTIGGNFGYNRLSLDLKDNTGSVSAAAFDMFTIMVESRIYWFNRPNVGMYSKPALGVMIANASLMDANDSQTIGLPTAHLSLVGVEFGGDMVRGFTELGAGFQGFLQLGLRFRI